MRVAVVGAGPVGLATTISMVQAGHRVTLIDCDAHRLEQLRLGTVPFYEPALGAAWTDSASSVQLAAEVRAAEGATAILVCVGTPALPDGSCDLAQVATVVDATDGLSPSTFVLRSTVPPGTGRRLQARLARYGHAYAAWPEFLREGAALEDARRPDRVVVGADRAAIHAQVFDLSSGLRCPHVAVDVPTAELIKVAANAHLAMRISFINEMALVAERVGADIRQVAYGIGLDPRIGPHCLQAGLGYGGSCFPKDTRALHVLGGVLGADLAILRSVIEVNNRMPHWVLRKVEERLGSLDERTVGVWGIAFKAHTDDTRDSQAVRLIETLAARGAQVCVHDPQARYRGGLASVRQVAEPLQAARGANALILATEWPEYAAVPAEEIGRIMSAPYLVVDARNALDVDAFLTAGLEYTGVGVPTPVMTADA